VADLLQTRLRRRRQPPHAPDLTRSGIFWGAESASSRHPIAKIVHVLMVRKTKMVRFLPVSIWGWLIPIMIIVMEKPVVAQQVRKLEIIFKNIASLHLNLKSHQIVI